LLGPLELNMLTAHIYLTYRTPSITHYHVKLFQSYRQYLIQQDAQLSQRDRAAGCIIVFAKSRRLELGDNILRTL